MEAESSSVDPRAVTLWRLQGLVRLGLLGLPLSLGAAVGVGMLAGRPAGLVAGLLLGLAFGAEALIWPVLTWRALRFALREHDLWMQEGVLFRSWSVVPYSRIQHVDTRQGPIERVLGLARLMVFTASGMGADAGISGLSEEEASRLRDLLSRRGGDDGV